MANSFDQFPLYDLIINPRTGKMADVWKDFFATFNQNLQNYLSENGVDLPQLTEALRDAQKNPPNGRMIYNTTAGKAQIREAGAWVNLV